MPPYQRAPVGPPWPTAMIAKTPTSTNARYDPLAERCRVAAALCGFGRYELMIVADLFDLSVYDFHHFRADCLHSSAVGSGAMEERLRHSVAAVACAY